MMCVLTVPTSTFSLRPRETCVKHTQKHAKTHDYSLRRVPSLTCFLVCFRDHQICENSRTCLHPLQQTFARHNTDQRSRFLPSQRLIDKTKVTCIKWIPGSPNQFLVAHGSGQMYVYNEELPCGPTSPHYQPFKTGDGFSVYTCKTKSTRNPLYRWVIGEGSLNQFAFSPCSKFLAVVSQDGYMRVFNYDQMELVGLMKSYFGGSLCVCWSPDGKYVCVGGEDDLVTVWSFQEKRVVCRGAGHKSWVNTVSFDPYTSLINDCDGFDFTGSDDDFGNNPVGTRTNVMQDRLSSHAAGGGGKNRGSTRSNPSSNAPGGATTATTRNSMVGADTKAPITSYRFGSIGQDTVVCLWDLTEDVLRQPLGRTRTSTIISPNAAGLPTTNSLPNAKANSVVKDGPMADGHAHNATAHTHTSLTQKFATLALGDHKKDKEDKKEHKRNFSLASRSSEKAQTLKANHTKPVDESLRLLGTPVCPRMEEVPILEPMVCKKIAQERLTDLVFREECLVTSCQEGYVCTWARPGKVVSTCVCACACQSACV